MITNAPSPVFPRRAFIAAALSAACAGGAVALATFGALSAPQSTDFAFARGTTLANGEAARLRGFLAQALQDDRLHVTIVGHTGQVGNASANLTLSAERAEVAAAMARDMGLPTERMTQTGLGGAAPLAKPDGIGERAYQASLARVTVSIQPRR